jgi:hypothetical protein
MALGGRAGKGPEPCDARVTVPRKGATLKEGNAPSILRIVYLSSRTRNLRARSRKAASPPSRMSQTALRIFELSSPPAK